MTLGSQLLLIFQFPGLSDPLGYLVSCMLGGGGLFVGGWMWMWPLGSESHFRMDGPFLQVPGPIAQTSGNGILLLASLQQLGFLL